MTTASTRSSTAPLAATRTEGGSTARENGAALPAGAPSNEARFLGQRLTAWISRLPTLCLPAAPRSLTREPSGTPGPVGAGAGPMAFAPFRTHHQPTRPMLRPSPQWPNTLGARSVSPHESFVPTA